jgi:uncharacterized protein
MTIDINDDILGAGWSFPIRTDKWGRIAMTAQERDIDESIVTILRTAKGERRMRPNFGSDLHTLVFAPNNANTWSLAVHYVQEALGWWEPRIEVIGVEVNPHALDGGMMEINIKYRVKATNDARNLVFPFFLLPGRA